MARRQAREAQSCLDKMLCPEKPLSRTQPRSGDLILPTQTEEEP